MEAKKPHRLLPASCRAREAVVRARSDLFKGRTTRIHKLKKREHLLFCLFFLLSPQGAGVCSTASGKAILTHCADPDAKMHLGHHQKGL